MTSRHRLAQYAIAIVTDSHALSANLPAALTALYDHTGGYPSSTPGAGPADSVGIIDADDAEHGRVALTSTERAATTLDAARRDREELDRQIRRACTALTRAATIAMRHGTPAINDEGVAKRLLGAVTADQGIWCPNCLRHRTSSVRAEGRALCRDCGDFKRIYGSDRPFGVVDSKARGIPLNSMKIEMILDREVPGWRTHRPKVKKAGAA